MARGEWTIKRAQDLRSGSTHGRIPDAGERRAAPGGSRQATLALQRQAGNRATSAHLRSGSSGWLPVQRGKGGTPAKAAAAGKPPYADLAKAEADALPDEKVLEMLDHCGRSWVRVKRTYVPHEPTMRRILAWREKITKELFKQVSDDLAKGGGWGDPQLSTMFAGSSDLTSDIDLTVISRNPEHGAKIEVAAVKEFNKRFRARFGGESGSVVDVNLYARDFIPAAFGVMGDRFKQLKSDFEAERDPVRKAELKKQMEDIKGRQGQEANASVEADEAWQQTTAGEAALAQVNDVMALVKLRRFLSADEWKAHLAAALQGVQDTGVRAQLTGQYQRADDLFRSTADEINTKIVSLNAKLYPLVTNLETRSTAIRQKKGEEAEMEASNRLYEESLDRVLVLGDQIDVLRREVAASGVRTQEQATRLDDLTRLYIKAKTRSLVFANESYHTGGALKDVVLGRQQGYTLALSLPQYLQSINEQAGFSAEQLKHTDPAGQGMWKSAKYMDRLCMALESISAMAPGFSVPAGAATLAPLAKDLLAVKKKEISDAQKCTEAIAVAGAYRFDSNEAILQLVLTIAAQAEGRIRSAMAGVPAEPTPGPVSGASGGEPAPALV